MDKVLLIENPKEEGDESLWVVDQYLVAMLPSQDGLLTL